MYPTSAGHLAAGLDEIRDRRPDYQVELKAFWFSRALPTRSDRSCHRVEDHPRSSWKLSSLASEGSAPS